jgi:hypothetical protein
MSFVVIDIRNAVIRRDGRARENPHAAPTAGIFNPSAILRMEILLTDPS